MICVIVIFMVLYFKFSVVHNALITRNEDIQNSYNGMCLTPDCINHAAFYLNNMDRQVNPCEDFYKYTCGNFIKTKLIPQDRYSVSSFTMVQDSLTSDLLNAMQMEIESDDLEAFKKMKMYYQNCLNESRIEEAGLAPYLNILQKAGGWPILMNDSWSEETYTWEDMMVNLQLLGFSAGFPFYLSIHVDSKNETNNIFHLYPPFTMISNETELYLENNKSLNAYKDYILDISVMLGANKSLIREEVQDLIDFEIDLLKLDVPFEETLKNSSSKQRKTILELTELYPSIQWFELFNRLANLENITIYETELIEVFDVNYFTKLEALLSKTPKRTLANYQIWQVLSRLINFMPAKFISRKRMYNNIIIEISTKTNREMMCLYLVKEALYIAVNGFYVRKYFNHEGKEKVMQMAIEIKNQFNENFQTIWRSEVNTTEEIVKQVNTMNMSIGYPDELLDDKKLEEFYTNLYIEPGLFIDTVLNSSLFKIKQIFKRLRKPADKNNWIFRAYVAFVNAFYNTENIIGIPAGILHEPFLYIGGPEYLNYGAIGSVIAHEITHGIYRAGLKTVANETTSTNNSTEHFNQCFINKYNNYNISEGIAVNGSSTLNENIPDVTGFKIAYQVYNKWIERHNITELNLPGLDHSPLQMFWVSAASTFCRKHETKYLQKQVRWDSHSPAEARINVGFSNIEDFSKDFNCKEGSRMNPTEKCKLW